MWKILGAGGISSGTSSADREDSDRLQSRPGGPVGSEFPSSRTALPGQAGTWFAEQSLAHISVSFSFQSVFCASGGGENCFVMC